MKGIAGTAERQAPAAERYAVLDQVARTPACYQDGTMSDLDKFRGHAIQARRLAPYTADKRTRIILELLSEELELKIAEIERRQAIDA
jgi:hypothetical protein